MAPEIEDWFWLTIRKSFSRGSNEDGLLDLQSRLSAMRPERVTQFQRALETVLERGLTWQLNGAACLVGHGNSDNGFLDFRAWLVTRGRETFERVLSDPDQLSEIPFDVTPTEEWYLEELLFVTGDLLPHGEISSYRQADYKGEHFKTTRAELKKRYPALWARFGGRHL